MEGYTIRPALPAELDQIWALVRRAVAKMNAEGSEQWGEDYPLRKDYEADISRGELLCAVTAEGRVLGVACVNQNEDPTYAAIPWTVPGPAMSVHRAAVDPEVQGHGLARALLTRAVALSREAGVASMRVDTYSKNTTMQRLLDSLGFVRRGEIRLHGRDLPYPAFEKLL